LLNLDLISVPVSVGNVVRDTNMLGNNVVEDVCDAALADTLNVCIQDAEIAEKFKGERLMFHPESGDDFTSPSNSTVPESGFDDFPFIDIRLSRSVLAATESMNATRVTPTLDVISGLSVKRKQELSVRRIDTIPGTQGVSGLYYLSVILRRDNDLFSAIDPLNDTTTVLHIDIVTREASCDPASLRILRYPVRGEMFYENGSLHTGAFELPLGLVEVLQDGPCVRIEEGAAAPEWVDTTQVHGSVKIIQRVDSLHIMSDSLDIQISYAYAWNNATCLLDAVCLTNPRTYGLLYPDSTRLLDVHRFHRGIAERRIASILNDEGRRAQFENLRFIAGPEQIEREGTWRTGKLMQRMIQQASGGTVQMYLATSASTDTVTTGAMHAGFVSGFYYYPVLTEHPVPTLTATDSDDYYESLHHHNHAGFAEEAISFRKHAEKRGAYGAKTPWIPYIQNHSNLYQTNQPDWWDRAPNREPSAAELRAQCNLALAHGAGGVMFYSFASAPWETADPFWPPDKNTWDAAIAGGGRALDPDMGTLGFIGQNDALRTCDWNGENKCDSIAAYNWDFLKPLGTYMLNNLQWRRSKVWNWQSEPTVAGANDYVTGVLSCRQDASGGFDNSYATYVTISEFDGKDNLAYLFVLNSRTHTEGQRHVTVKLVPASGDREWKITEVHGPDDDGDIWIVRPNPDPDTTTVANGFTVYFEAGQARLFRLEEIEDETTNFSFKDGDACPDRSIYVEPAAMLRLKSSDVVAFAPGNGLYCDGALRAIGTTFRPCATEGTWDGIVSRDHASAYLEGVTVNGAGV
ncbi:MAG: hypothetical protein WBQ23_02930, partial [Bacteroidota bacterium]